MTWIEFMLLISKNWYNGIIYFKRRIITKEAFVKEEEPTVTDAEVVEEPKAEKTNCKKAAPKAEKPAAPKAKASSAAKST
jgi:hypothetical protein